jgi:hypothetical protein
MQKIHQGSPFQTLKTINSKQIMDKLQQLFTTANIIKHKIKIQKGNFQCKIPPKSLNDKQGSNVYIYKI